MKVNAPLISASPLLKDGNELTDQALPAGDFSSMLFLMMPPQNSLPITNPTGETDATTGATAAGSNNRSMPAPLLDLQVPIAPQDNNRNFRTGWHRPFTIDSFSGEITPALNGAAADAPQEGPAVLSLPTEAVRIALPDDETADRPAADWQIAESEAHQPLVLKAIHTAAEVAAIFDSAPQEANPLADTGTTANTESEAAVPPPITRKPEDGFDAKVETAVLSYDANAQSHWPATQTTVDLPQQTLDTTKEGFSPAVPDVPLELIEDAPAGALSRPVEAAVSDSGNQAPATSADVAEQASAPTMVFPVARPTAKTDWLEHRSTKTETSGNRTQAIPSDSTETTARLQQAPSRPVTAVPDQELNFGGETPGGRKAGEHLPKEQRHDPQALASVAALNAPSSELHQSAEAKSTVGPASVLHKVAGEIAKSVQGKRHEAIMTLDPPELGSLKIGLVVEGDKIRVRILAETRDARELIEHHLGELKQALQIQQFDSVDVLIESGRFDSAGDPRQGFQQPSQDRRRPEINSVRFFESKDVPAEFRQVSRTRMDSDRVSMWA